MAVTPYKAVRFKKNETITKHEMDQLQSNYQWIHDHTPRGAVYKRDMTRIESPLIIVCGKRRVMRDRKTNKGKASVKFGGNLFHPDSRPMITTGIISDKEKKMFVVLSGPGGINFPNSHGFDIHINVVEKKKAKKKKRPKDEESKKKEKKPTVEREFWIAWSALGYRKEDKDEF